jgi:hypothetical protein
VDLGSNAAINGFNFNPTSNSASFPAAMFNGNASLSNSVFNNAAGVAVSVAASSFTSLSDAILLSPASADGALVGSGAVFYSHLTFGENATMAGTLTLIAAPTSDKLAALSDVNVPSPNQDDVLMYDAGSNKWIASPVVLSDVVTPPLANLPDVSFGEGPENGDTIVYDYASGIWVNQKLSFSNMADYFAEGEPGNGSILIYNAGAGQWTTSAAFTDMQAQIQDLVERVYALENPT